MRNLQSSYWNIAAQIMEYAVDVSVQSSVSHDGQSISEINEPVFLERLYALREHDSFEERLIQTMLQSLSVVCVIGSRGCGKTSAIRYAVRALRSRPCALPIILLDIKRLFNQELLSGLDNGIATKHFRRVIREQVMSTLFPDHSSATDLLAWLLAGPPDASESFDGSVLTDLYDSSMITLSQAQASRGSRRERYASLRDWLNKDERRYAGTFQLVDSRLRAAHIVQAAAKLLANATKSIIIYDNVDRIPARFQPSFLEEVNDSQLSLGSVCTSVIAIRRENVHAVQPRAGAGGDYLAYVSPQSEQFPAVLLPRASSDHIKNVLERRHQFTVALYDQVVRAQSDTHRGVSSAYEAVVHHAVVREFLDHSIHNLANGSVRSIISIYNAFMQYLLIIEERKLVEFSKMLTRKAVSEKHLQTLFFLWLKELGNLHDIPLYDLHRRPDLEETAERYAANALEHHLLLTCVLNLSPRDQSNENKGAYPTFNLVCSSMKSLGFSLRTIKNALGEMCAKPGEQPRTIEFFESECEVEALTFESTDRLRLTPLGRELVTQICSKVGYVWGLAYDQAPEEMKRHGRSYHEMDVVERIEILYGYAERRAQAHLRLMSLLAREWRPEFGSRWLSTYRQRFGVRRLLQIERILESAEHFYTPLFNNFGERNFFTELLEAYRALLTRIELGADFEELDVDELSRPRRSLSELRRRYGRAKRKRPAPAGSSPRR